MKTRTLTTASLGRLLGCALMVPVACIAQDNLKASFERDMHRTPARARVDLALWSGEHAPYRVAGSRYAGQGSGDPIAASFERDMHRTPTRDSVASVVRGTDPLHKLINMALWTREDSLQLATSEITGNAQNRGL